MIRISVFLSTALLISCGGDSANSSRETNEGSVNTSETVTGAALNNSEEVAVIAGIDKVTQTQEQYEGVSAAEAEPESEPPAYQTIPVEYQGLWIQYCTTEAYLNPDYNEYRSTLMTITADTVTKEIIKHHNWRCSDTQYGTTVIEYQLPGYNSSTQTELGEAINLDLSATSVFYAEERNPHWYWNSQGVADEYDIAYLDGEDILYTGAYLPAHTIENRPTQLNTDYYQRVHRYNAPESILFFRDDSDMPFPEKPF